MVTGAPAKLRERREELTPMLTQYVELAEEYDDAVVLFRVGDFYKAFCEAAEEVARICELTLIEREDSTGTYAACGIPTDNPATYLDRLLDAGYRLAIADQVEDPEEAIGLVDRAVTRVVTPGTVADEELLSADSATFLASVARHPDAAPSTGPNNPANADETTNTDGSGERADGVETNDETYGLAYVDVSTGECGVTSGDRAAITEELTRIAPAEYLPGPGVELSPPGDPTRTTHEGFDPRAARERVARYTTPDRFGPTQRVALGGLLSYAEYTQGDDGPLAHVNRVRRYDPRRSLRLDAAALRGLELFESREPSGRPLIEEIDETRSALGRRRLRAWLRRPLVDADRITARHDAVAALAERSLVRAELREAFASAYDLERLVGRVARGRADARDLRSLQTTLATVPDLRAAIDGIDALAGLRADLDPVADVREEIAAAIVPDPPTEVTDGGVIRDGYDETLDELRETAREGREWIADLEAEERERTGIDNLEVGYNQVHGYYIEVTNSNLDRVPDEYTRRQTLKNAERFYTPPLKRREDEILGAEERADGREYELFTAVRERVGEATERLQAVADAIARLDALAALAAVAVERDYCRPTVGAEAVSVERGRHPVVERTEPEFVPNDAHLPPGSVTVVTGPNMSGKSTYMRQVATHAVLAQAGSFVPAASAELPVVDRVFTRVGASDDIAGGQSTFMREMAELTEILHDATPDSLVLLDEVGRGTSTADGRAIARAAVEYVHREVGATTIFATHYHELTALADRLDGVRNRHFAATRTDGDVTFLHRVRPGGASSSYGIEVARMAGVPAPVVDRARELVESEADWSVDAAADTAAADAGRAADDERADGATDVESGDATAAADAPNGDGRQTTAVTRSGEGTDGAEGNAGDGVETDADGGVGADDADETASRRTLDALGEKRAATNGSRAGEATADADSGVTTDLAVGGSGSGRPTGDRAVGDEESLATERAVLAELTEVELAETTPMEALQTLRTLQRQLRGDEP